jgi:hypothetical protein
MKSSSVAFLLILLLASQCFGQRLLMGQGFAKNRIHEAIKENYIVNNEHKLIIDKTTAIAVAEIYLFKVYGKKQILKERPYEVYLIDGYWWMMGTLPKGWDGGGFELIMNAKNGQIIYLTHYR